MRVSYWTPWRVWLTDRTRQGTSCLGLPMLWTRYRWNSPLAVPTLVCWSQLFFQSLCSRGRTSSEAARTAYALPSRWSCFVCSISDRIWMMINALREDPIHQVLLLPSVWGHDAQPPNSYLKDWANLTLCLETYGSKVKVASQRTALEPGASLATHSVHWPSHRVSHVSLLAPRTLLPPDRHPAIESDSFPKSSSVQTMASVSGLHLPT